MQVQREQCGYEKLQSVKIEPLSNGRSQLVETQAVRENLMLDMIVLQDPTESVYGPWRCTRPDTGSRKERLHRSVGGSWEEFKSPLRHGGRTRMKGAYWNPGGI